MEKDEALKCKQQYHDTHASNVENSEKIHLLSNLCDKPDCQSKMTVKILTMQLLSNLCEVQLWWNHNHSVDPHYLTSFNPILLATKHKFYSYFEQGMSASEAFHYHENLIIKDPVTILLLDDRKCCPSLHDANNLYEK